jgi:hypothetical protein
MIQKATVMLESSQCTCCEVDAVYWSERLFISQRVGALTHSASQELKTKCHVNCQYKLRFDAWN